MCLPRKPLSRTKISYYLIASEETKHRVTTKKSSFSENNEISALQRKLWGRSNEWSQKGGSIYMSISGAFIKNQVQKEKNNILKYWEIGVMTATLKGRGF